MESMIDRLVPLLTDDPTQYAIARRAAFRLVSSHQPVDEADFLLASQAIACALTMLRTLGDANRTDLPVPQLLRLLSQAAGLSRREAHLSKRRLDRTARLKRPNPAYANPGQPNPGHPNPTQPGPAHPGPARPTPPSAAAGAAPATPHPRPMAGGAAAQVGTPPRSAEPASPSVSASAQATQASATAEHRTTDQATIPDAALDHAALKPGSGPMHAAAITRSAAASASAPAPTNAPASATAKASAPAAPHNLTRANVTPAASAKRLGDADNNAELEALFARATQEWGRNSGNLASATALAAGTGGRPTGNGPAGNGPAGNGPAVRWANRPAAAMRAAPAGGQSLSASPR